MGRKKSIGFYNFAYSRKELYASLCPKPLTHQMVIECANRDWNAMTDVERDVWIQKHERRKLETRRRQKQAIDGGDVFHEIKEVLHCMDQVKEILDQMGCEGEQGADGDGGDETTIAADSKQQPERDALKEQNELAERITISIESLFV